MALFGALVGKVNIEASRPRLARTPPRWTTYTGSRVELTRVMLRAVVDAVISGLLAGYGIAVPVGAIAILIMSLAARASWRVGCAAALGTATADGLYAAIAVLGGAAAAHAVSSFATPLRWTAALVLAALAVRTAVMASRRGPARTPAAVTPASAKPERAPAATSSAAWRGASAHRDAASQPRFTGLSTPGRAYLGLLGLTVLNPATVVYFAALVLGRQGAVRWPVLNSVLFVLAAFVASATWQLLLAVGGAAAGRVLAGPRAQRATAFVSSAVILGLAVRLIV